MRNHLEERGKYLITLCDEAGDALFSKSFIAHKRIHLPPLRAESKGDFYRVMTPSGKVVEVKPDKICN